MNTKLTDHFLENSSETIFQAAANGDHDALSFLSKQYYPLIFQMASHHFRRAHRNLPFEDAEDIAQNVLLRLPAILKNFCSSATVCFEAFLTGSIRFVVLDMIKKNSSERKYRRHSDQIDYLMENSPAQQDPIDETRISLRQSLTSLQKSNPALGQIINDYYNHDQNDQQIAKQQNRHKFQIFRARQKALAHLAEFIDCQY